MKFWIIVGHVFSVVVFHELYDHGHLFSAVVSWNYGHCWWYVLCCCFSWTFTIETSHRVVMFHEFMIVVGHVFFVVVFHEHYDCSRSFFSLVAEFHKLYYCYSSVKFHELMIIVGHVFSAVAFHKLYDRCWLHVLCCWVSWALWLWFVLTFLTYTTTFQMVFVVFFIQSSAPLQIMP